MTDKRIELRENGVLYMGRPVKEGFVEGTAPAALSYSVKLFDPNKCTFPVYAVDVAAQNTDNHYILRTVHESNGTGQPTPRIFGVSDTSEEADKRLYEKAKEIAREMAQRHHVRDLEDLTRHYRSLPRGGK